MTSKEEGKEAKGIQQKIAFYKDMLPRIMAKVDDGAEEEANIRREKMAIAEIRELLAQMVQE